jgi:GDP-L-fucose synthase
MKVAILGARGFIGSYLCTYLQSKKYDILPIYRGDLDLLSFWHVQHWIKTNSPDVIINCAIAGGGSTVHEINFQDAQINLNIFFNFYNSDYKFKYINIGSGAEFDKSRPIHNMNEVDIFDRIPKDSYGYSKNIISRATKAKDNFYTLRLFGCFGSQESSIRLFKRYLSGQLQLVQDRYFDYISISDFSKIAEYYCVNENKIKDLNCVYKEKFLLSQILKKLKTIKNVKYDILTDSKIYNSYTGGHYLIDKLMKDENFPELEGLEQGLKEYE